MLRRPWQVWTLIGLVIAAALAGMVVLTVQVSYLDRMRETDRRETELARQEAELQERISSALYRLDWWATPLVAQEAARPYYMYEPFYRISVEGSAANRSELATKGTEVERASPLMFDSSEFVVLHFQINDQGELTSPERPQGEICDRAVGCGVDETRVQAKDSFLKEAESFGDFSSIAAVCTPVATESNIASQSPFQMTYRYGNHKPYENPLTTGDANPTLVDSNNPSLDPPESLKLGKSTQQQNRNVQRGNIDYVQRSQTMEQNTFSQWSDNKSNLLQSIDQERGLVREGIMRPVWLNSKLLLARRVESPAGVVVQCCWLNWTKIEEQMRKEVADLLPDVRFQPVTDSGQIRFGRTMATLPVELNVDSEALKTSLALSSHVPLETFPSGLRMSLWFAWGGLGTAAIAFSGLMLGVMRLSERRAAFVSAVTHELRTPLTTFRMYSEMLAEKMVPPELEGEYTQTLKTEADRLSHLVENVLQFARLERSPASPVVDLIPLGELWDRAEERLRQRVNDAQMELVCRMDDESRQRAVRLDGMKFEQILFNLVDNACKYAAAAVDRQILVEFSTTDKALRIAVQDFGPGIGAKFRRRLFQPFCKSDQDAADSWAGVGLGLALCHRIVASMRGRIRLDDSPVGARFVITFPNRQIS